MAKQLAQLETRAEKVVVAHKRVFHARRGERRWKLRLPNTLRKPDPFRPRAEMLLHIIGQPRDLLLPIGGGEANKNRLIISAAYDFDLSAFHETAQSLEIFRVRALHPFEQRAGIVQSDAKGGGWV